MAIQDIIKICTLICMFATVCLWIVRCCVVSAKVKDVDMGNQTHIRQIMYGLDVNKLPMNSTQEELTLALRSANAIAVMQMLMRVLPFIVCMIGLLMQNYFTLHTGILISLISLFVDNFDIYNRWNELIHPDVGFDFGSNNNVYVISHLLHLMGASLAVIFSMNIDDNTIGAS